MGSLSQRGPGSPPPLGDPSLGSPSDGGLPSEHPHQDHLTPAAAKPLGNAKSLLASNGLGDIHFPALSSRPAQSLGNASAAAVTVTAAGRRAVCPAPVGGSDLLRRGRGGEVDAALPGPGQSESGGLAGGGEGAGSSQSLARFCTETGGAQGCGSVCVCAV